MIATLDTPVSSAELNAFYGIEIEDTSAANGVLRALRALSPSQLTPVVASVIAASFASQLSASNHAHTDNTQAAIERLDDAQTFLIGD